MYQRAQELWKESCIKQNIPIISTATEDFLGSYLHRIQPHHIIEIGSAAGYSTSIIGHILESYSLLGTLHSREISYPHYYQGILHTSTYKNITTYLGNFCHYNLNKYLHRGYYDMAFIDGRKSETLLYIQKLIPYLHDTSSIIVDDAIKFKHKMQDCYDLLDNNNITYQTQLLDNDDGVLIIPQVGPLIQALYALSPLESHS